MQEQKELLGQNQWWFLSRHLSGNPTALNTVGPGALTLPASPTHPAPRLQPRLRGPERVKPMLFKGQL